MKTVGIIVEYNPLHNGHVYHIEQVKKHSQCDVLICVMSASFTQRGEPAIIDKFNRTKFALQNGIDLVIELPFVFGVQNADIFAYTSVGILEKLGVKDIYFGSENNDIDELYHIGEIMAKDEYNHLVKKYSKQGYSYPTASDMAMQNIYPNEVFSKPNNILGIQYILAGKKLDSEIRFHTVNRISTDYFDEIQEGTKIQSASAIRRQIEMQESIKDFVPEDVSTTFINTTPVTYEDFYHALHYIINRSKTEELRSIYHVNEGLENRIMKIHSFGSVRDFINLLITKRYTNSKLQRMIAHILCNVQKTDIPSFEIPYIRVLGMNQSGQRYLNQIKHTIDVPLYTKIKEGLHPYIDIELRVSKVYATVATTFQYEDEFKPVIL